MKSQQTTTHVIKIISGKSSHSIDEFIDFSNAVDNVKEIK